jgi:hypothetical protein
MLVGVGYGSVGFDARGHRRGHGRSLFWLPGCAHGHWPSVRKGGIRALLSRICLFRARRSLMRRPVVSVLVAALAAGTIGCVPEIPDILIARTRRTATAPSKASLYFEKFTPGAPHAVLERVVIPIGQDPDPTDPPEPADPDPPIPIELPPPPPPEPIPDNCKPPWCIDFNQANGHEYFWPVRKRPRPKPGDPPPFLWMIRDTRHAKYPGLTTVYAGRVPMLVARRMVITNPNFQTDFDKAATGIPQPVALPNPLPPQMIPPICAWAICFEFSHAKGTGIQLIRIENR